jgi:hypothetical protein
LTRKRLGAKLIDAFKLSELQAAAILGNIVHECAGFTQLQERNPHGGRGGYGWAQWTGPRRRAFEEYCQLNRLAPESDEANYGFLQHELSTTEKGTISALNGQDDLIDYPRSSPWPEATKERANFRPTGSQQFLSGR